MKRFCNKYEKVTNGQQNITSIGLVLCMTFNKCVFGLTKLTAELYCRHILFNVNTSVDRHGSSSVLESLTVLSELYFRLSLK